MSGRSLACLYACSKYNCQLFFAINTNAIQSQCRLAERIISVMRARRLRLAVTQSVESECAHCLLLAAYICIYAYIFISMKQRAIHIGQLVIVGRRFNSVGRHAHWRSGHARSRC